MDDHLRRLEQQSEGDREGEAQALVARLRAGKLGRSQLELAAYLGHPPPS